MFSGLLSRIARIGIAIALVAIPTSMAHAQSAEVIRGPYLQMGTPSSVTARWRTDTATDSVVRYGLSSSNLDQSTSVAASTTEHEVALTGLSANTRYYYSVGDSSGALAGGDESTYFETGPTIGDAQLTRIWVIGDAGTADSNAQAVYDAYRSYAGDTYTDLWLMLGDNAYDDGTDSEYQTAVFDIYPELLRQTVVWPTIGNHDAVASDSPTESGPYFDIFNLPRQGELGGAASGTEAYYSFDYANIHFIVLDSHDTNRQPGSPMLTWLESDLQTATADWLIAFWHHPPYSKGSHDSDSEGRLIDMRENVLPILEDYGVDLVLAGHSHSYERSILLDSHYGSSGSLTSSMILDGGDGRVDGDGAYNKATGGLGAHEGAVYVVAGSSGKLSNGSLDHPAMYVSLLQLGSVVLDVNGLVLDASFINDSGAVTDYFTLTKGPGNCTITETPEQSCGDGQDNDCDGFTDAADTDCCPDSDGDGYNDVACGGTDCNDGNIDVNPGAMESCGDEIDNDCNGDTDCADNACLGDLACCADSDGDGYADEACGGTDCHDGDETVHPDAVEVCDDSQDNNCNDLTDCAEGSCAGVGSCPAEPRTVIVTEVSDSHVRELSPNGNFGSTSALEIDTANVFKYALVKPDNLGDIEPGAQVVKAELVINVFNPGNTVEVHELLASWEENAVTYDNAPAASLTAHTTFDGTVGEISIDITSIAQGWVNGDATNGVRLYPTGSNGVGVRSSETGDSAVRPYFVFEVLESSGGGGCDDADSDGYTDSACGGTDCVDDNADINPGAAEICDDLVDNDCDSSTDCADGDCSADPICTGGGGQRTVLLTELDDALVRSATPTRNFGTWTSLELDSDTVVMHAFVKPNNLSDIAPGAQVVSAELVLTIFNQGDTVELREAQESWDEGTITWNNAPAISAALDTFAADATGEVTVDVTSIMQSWVDGAAIHGVNLYPTGGNGVSIRSMEHDTSEQRPYFRVEVIE